MFNKFKRTKELTYDIYETKEVFNPFHEIIGTVTIYGKSVDDVMKQYYRDKEFHKKNGHSLTIMKRSWM